MNEKYRQAEREARHGASIPIGNGRVKPEFFEFLRAKDAGIISRTTTFQQYQADKIKTKES